MLASLLLCRSSPKRFDERAGDCRAGHGDPIDSARGQRGGNLGIGPLDIAARVDDHLLDNAAGREEFLGQHFAPAAGSGQEESLPPGIENQCRGQRFGPIFVGHQVGLEMVAGQLLGRAGTDRGKLNVRQPAQIAAACQQPIEQIPHSIGA